MSDKERSVQEIVEQAIKEQDIRFDQEDRLMYWFKRPDFRRVEQEVQRRMGEGEYWSLNSGAGSIAGVKWGLAGIMCKGYEYRRHIPLIEQLGVEFRVNRVFNKYRLPYEEWVKRWPRGSLIITVPREFGTENKR